MTQNEIIRQRFPHEKTQGIADDLGLTYSQVANRAFSMGLKKTLEFKRSESSGRHNLIEGGKKFRYTPGHTPFNKGKEMPAEIYEKVKATMFKKGNRPHNWKPDGTIVARKDADQSGRVYLYYKVRDSKWILYHNKVWIDQNGPIPKGNIIRFIDGNTKNCDITNLEMVSMKDNMLRNSIQRFPEEIQQVIKLTSKLNKSINGKKQNQ
jgi:urease beta subunit